MPRDGTQTYVLPFPDVVADTTIESPVYNGFTNDVAQDLNLPRPVVAGGTGATSAAGALANLGGETASQVVTNYDSYVFKPGSFYSAAGATAAPTANAFSGICYLSDANNIVIEARDSTTGILYVRRKIAGMWNTFAVDGATNFVELSGDTMSGDLTINKADPALVLSKAASGQANIINGTLNGVSRWTISPGNGVAESTGNAGSDFAIYRFNDAGALLSPVAMSITRATGAATFESTLQATTVKSVETAGTGTYHFGNTGTKSLSFDGTQFSLNGGNLLVPNGSLSVTGEIRAQQGTTGTYQFGTSGTKYLQFDGASTFNFVGGSVAVLNGSLRSYLPSGGLHLQLTETTGSWSKYLRVINGGNLEVVNSANSGVIMTLTDVGMLICNSANIQSVATSTVTAGTSVTVGSTVLGPVSVELGPTTGGAVQSYIDFHCGFASDFEARIIATGSSAGVGTLAYTATSHTFNNIISCASTIESTGHRCRQGLSGGFNSNYYNLFYNAGPMQLWADATNLGNISVISDYRTKKDVAALPSTWNAVKALRPIKYTQKDFSPPSHKGDDPFIRGDNNERWGFMAHELQETLVMEAATGAKDAADAIQSPNPMIVIAALTKALQEAMTRIEALEAR